MFTTMIFAAALAGGAPQDPCSANGGFPDGSFGAVQARMRALADGSYAACVEARRAGRPATNRQPPRTVTTPRAYEPVEAPRAYQPVAATTVARPPLGGIHAEGRMAVLEKLDHSNEATFTGVRAVTGERGIAYCGYLRGRSGAGTMTNDVAFISVVTFTGERFAAINEATDPQVQTNFRTTWSTYCLGGSPVDF